MSDARYRAAPLDWGTVVITATWWMSAASLVALGVFGLVVGISKPEPWAIVLGFFGLGGALLVAPVPWLMRRVRPVAYAVDGDELVVVLSGAEPVRYEGDLSSARRASLRRPLSPVYGYHGEEQTKDGSSVTAHATSLARIVVLTVGEQTLAISPVDPDAFVRDIQARP